MECTAETKLFISSKVAKYNTGAANGKSDVRFV